MIKRVIVPCIAVLGLVLLIAACGGDGDDDSNGDADGAPTEVEDSVDNGDGVAACTANSQQYAAAPAITIDTNKTYVATIKTNKGDIVVELDPNVTVTTNNFVFLAREGYYDCLTFHRVEPGFVIQGGDPAGNGTGGPGYGIPPEFEGSIFETGVIGMARSAAPDSAGSQFYIMLGRAENLDGSYASFGNVTSGMNVVEQIVIGDIMETITIEER